jgi:hypothetical protein
MPVSHSQNFLNTFRVEDMVAERHQPHFDPSYKIIKTDDAVFNIEAVSLAPVLKFLHLLEFLNNFKGQNLNLVTTLNNMVSIAIPVIPSSFFLRAFVPNSSHGTNTCHEEDDYNSSDNQSNYAFRLRSFFCTCTCRLIWIIFPNGINLTNSVICA